MIFTAGLQDIQNQIGKFNTHVQIYAQEVQHATSEFQNTLNQAQTDYTNWTQQYQIYDSKFKEFMVGRLGQPPAEQQQPQPQQRGRRNAR